MLLHDLFAGLKTPLREGRDAPLYHATSLDAALDILTDNAITGTTGQLLNGRRGKRFKIRHDDYYGAVYGYKMKGGREAKGVSLTRDYAFAISWLRASVVFVLDQAKLAHHHQIVPHDHTNNGAYDYAKMGFEHMEQAEEFVIGDIRPLSGCLLSVNITQHDLDRVTLDRFADHRALWVHPLINRVYPRQYRTLYSRPHFDAEYDDASYQRKKYLALKRQGWSADAIIAHMQASEPATQDD